MLLVIHNLPLNTRFGDVKSLLLEKCGLRNLILDKLIFEDNAMKITVGLPTEEDAALLVRKINGLYLKGHQLYVQDLRQKPSEQPYRLPKPGIQQDNNQQQSWTDNQQQSWASNQQQGWNNNPQQTRTSNQQQSWNNNQQQSWNNNQQQSWNNPVETRANGSQRNSNQFSNQHQNRNIEGGYGQELATAAAMWAQQAQQVNVTYDSQSVHFPQNVQYPQQFNQFDTQGYGGWDQVNQVNQGFERGGGDYTNVNTSWGESSVSAPHDRSQDTRQSSESRRRRSDRSFEQEPRDHSRQHSQPRVERLERPQGGKKRRWDESEQGADDWRQWPASPPRDFRQHHRDKGAPQRSGFDSAAEPWTNAPDQRFQPSNSRFDAPKPRFDAPKPRFDAPKPRFDVPKPRFDAPKPRFEASKSNFEPKSKFNKKQKFNTAYQKFNAPNQKFNTPNQKFKPRFDPQNRPNLPKPRLGFNNKKVQLDEIPWDELTEKQQQKVLKRNEFNRSRTVTRITFDIFNELGLDQEDKVLKSYFTDPVRSRLNKVLGNEKFDRLDMMYAKYLDVYNDEKQQILDEARQLQRDGVEPKLQKWFINPAFINPPAEFGEAFAPPQAKRFKADGVKTSPLPGPPKPVSGKIPSYVDGDRKKFKEIKQQHLKDMATMRCPDVGPELDAVADAEVDAIADIFRKVAENAPDETQKAFLLERVNEECIDDFKKMFKQKICQRLNNEGPKIVRIYAFSGKPPKKAELEPFMRQFDAIALKKSDRKPFFTAHLNSYKTLDQLCNMGSVKVGNCQVVFKPLHMTPKYKRIHISSLNKMRNKYVANQKRKPEVNILEKDWEIKLAAIKEKEEKLKQEKSLLEAAKEEVLKQEKAVRDAVKKETDVNAENGDGELENSNFNRDNANVNPETGNVNPETGNVNPETGNVNPENGNVNPENGNVNPETGNVKPETGNVKPEAGNVKPEAGNVKSESDSVKPEIPENPNMDIHTNKYGELHANFDVIDEVQGSDNENDAKNDVNTDDLNENEVPEKSDESILRELPVGSDPEIIYDEADGDENEIEDDDNEVEGDNDQTIAEDIDLDNIDEDDLEDY